MASSRAIASVVADAKRRVRREIAAWAGALFVDGAAHRVADFTGQRDAARRRFVGAAHANQRRSERNGERHGNTRRLARGQVGAMKIDAKRRATGAAAGTGKVRHGRGEKVGKAAIVSQPPSGG